MASLDAIFAVSLTLDTWQRCYVCRVPSLCRGPCLVAHDKQRLCRVPYLCRASSLLAHGKWCLCRVPDCSPTANFLAYGKGEVSDSGSRITFSFSGVGYFHTMELPCCKSMQKFGIQSKPGITQSHRSDGLIDQ